MTMTVNHCTRITAIDRLRGLVLIVMTLDHTRDFFSDARVKPTDLEHSWPALFLTRWITHFCAPVFVFLAGTSAYLWWQRRGGDHGALSRFLAERGGLILLLTLTVEAWAWNFSYEVQQLDGGVLWAIGWSMLALALLSRLPLPALLLLAVLMIAGHNALDGWQPDGQGAAAKLWAVLHTGEKFPLSDGLSMNPYYPLVPWIGVMALGFVFGAYCRQAPRPRSLVWAGVLTVMAFVVLRFSNLYGDPDPWQVYDHSLLTVLSFLNCHKYPPSLLYLLMTLGPALMVLGLFLALPDNALPRLQVFGRTPLVFYLVHLYLIHGLAVLLAVVSNGPVAAIRTGGIWVSDLPADYGYGLPVVYGIWVSVVCLLYPLCRGFERLKQARPHWRWLKYF